MSLVKDTEDEPEVTSIKLNHNTAYPRDVYSWFEITLQDVDVANQTFTAAIEIHCFWQDFSLPSFFNIEDELVLDAESVPIKLSEVFENKLSIDFLVGPNYEYIAENSTIYMFLSTSAVFTERLELQRFPIDRQFLNIKFNARVKEGNWNWIGKFPSWVPPKFDKPISVRKSSSIAEYDLLNPWADFSVEPFQIRLRVDRKPDYFLGNIIFPNFLIVAACFSSFVIPRDQVASRLSITLNLLITAVAFRFIITPMLPKVNYLTWMDYYMLTGFIGLIIFTAENAIAGLPSLSYTVGLSIDLVAALLFAVIWIVIHIIVVLLLVCNELGRVPWKKMDLIDSTSTEEKEEFFFAKRLDIKGNKESEQSKKEWEKYEPIMPPARRARHFVRDHIELATRAGLSITRRSTVVPSSLVPSSLQNFNPKSPVIVTTNSDDSINNEDRIIDVLSPSENKNKKQNLNIIEENLGFSIELGLS